MEEWRNGGMEEWRNGVSESPAIPKLQYSISLSAEGFFEGGDFEVEIEGPVLYDV